MTDQVHILVCSALGVGHFIPTCRIARILSTVTLTNGAKIVVSFFAPCREGDMETTDIGPNNPACFVYRKVALSQAHNTNMGAMLTEKSRLHRELREFLDGEPNNRGWPACNLVIHDQFAVYVKTYIATQCYPKPRRVILSSSHSLPASIICDPEFRLALKERRSFKPKHFDHEWPLEILDLLLDFMNVDEPVLRELGMDIFKPDLPMVFTQDIPVLSDDVVEEAQRLMRERWEGVRLIPVSCVERQTVMSSVSARGTPLNWLDSQQRDSVAFVAMGTLYSVPCAELIKLAQSLDALGIKSIWAYKQRAGEDDLNLPEWNGLRTDLQRRGSCVFHDWVDQRAVLSHEAIRIFVTHCGWNSVTENLVLRGVPMLCLPLGAEQHTNAAWITLELGIGIMGIDIEKEIDAAASADSGSLKTPRRMPSNAVPLDHADLSTTDDLSSADGLPKGGSSDSGLSQDDSDPFGGWGKLISAGKPTGCGSGRPVRFVEVEKLKKLLDDICFRDYDSYRARAGGVHESIRGHCEWAVVAERLRLVLSDTLSDIPFAS